jgi:hypothetical protein
MEISIGHAESLLLTDQNRELVCYSILQVTHIGASYIGLFLTAAVTATVLSAAVTNK